MMYVGPRNDRDFFTVPAQPVELGGYTRVDLGGQYRLPIARASDDWATTLRVENVFAHRYQEIAGFPAPGRVLLVGVRVNVGKQRPVD